MESNSPLFSSSNEEMLPYMSSYLHVGRKEEDWKYQRVDFQDTGLFASFDLVNPFISDLDSGGFHLSASTSQEVCSELLIFWLLKKAGLNVKPGEAWVKEMSYLGISPIRMSCGIQASLDVKKFRCGTKLLFADGRFRLEDNCGGLSKVNIKGSISLS